MLSQLTPTNLTAVRGDAHAEYPGLCDRVEGTLGKLQKLKNGISICGIGCQALCRMSDAVRLLAREGHSK